MRLLYEHYYVARMPETGHQHARGHCPMFSEDVAHSGSAAYQGALTYRGDVAEVKVTFPLKAMQSQARIATPSRAAHGATRRGAMGLAGLMSLLWTHAGLNSWTPGTVLPWLRVNSLLRAAAEAIYLGKRKLAEHLFVQGVPGNDGASWLPSPPAAAKDWDQYRLVLFKVGTAVNTPYGGAWFKAASGDAFLITQAVLARLGSSYPRVIHALTQATEAEGQVHTRTPGVVCLALARWKLVRGAPCLSVLQAALMMVNWRCIPVESTYELLVADQLVEQQRRFTKPMRFDAAKDDVFPDFLLSDAGLHSVPMEVYGVSGNAGYETRKVAKRVLYLASGQAFWEWTPPIAGE